VTPLKYDIFTKICYFLALLQDSYQNSLKVCFIKKTGCYLKIQ
jgi:hypothetical protein